MSNKDTVCYTTKQLAAMQHDSQTDYDRIDKLTDADIEAASMEDPDLQETLGNWYESAVMVAPQAKQQLTLRLEPEVINWYRGLGKGYQRRMGDVLKAYMQHHKKQ